MSIQLVRVFDSLDSASVDTYKTGSANDVTPEAEYGIGLRQMPLRLDVKRFFDRCSPVSKKYNTPLIGSQIPSNLLDMGLRDRPIHNASLLPLYKHYFRSVDSTIVLSEVPDAAEVFLALNGVADQIGYAVPIQVCSTRTTSPRRWSSTSAAYRRPRGSTT